MKNLFIALSFCLLSTILSGQNVGIGTTTPDPTAALDISSGDKGILIPRTTKIAVQMASPGTASIPIGLLIFDTDDSKFYFWNGAEWENLSGSSTFEIVNGVVRNTGDHAAEDFVFGSHQLPQNGVSTSDTLLFFEKEKGAFRVGTIDSDNWSMDNIGAYSFASGFNTKASGDYSTAMGWDNLASGNNSTAMGAFTRALGSHSTSMGNQTEASGYASTAIGNQTDATGPSSTAMGLHTKSTEGASTAMGRASIAIAKFSIAAGDSIISSSQSEFALGAYNTIDATANPSSWVATDRLFTIGNGTSGNRSDAMIVHKNGNTEINGEVQLRDGWVHADGFTKMQLNSGELKYNYQGVDYFELSGIGVGRTRIEFPSNNNNILLGSNTLGAAGSGNNNIAIGTNSLRSTSGDGNVALGYEAGKSETGSNKLYIENSSANADNALIYGEFDNNVLKLNGDVTVKNELEVEERIYAKNGFFFGDDSGALPSSAGTGVRAFFDTGLNKDRGSIFGYDYTSGSVGPKNLVLQDPGGNVGIGSLTPTHRLTIKALKDGALGGIRLNATSWNNWVINTHTSTNDDLNFYYNGSTRGWLNYESSAGNIDFTAQHRNIPADGKSTDYADKIGMIVSSSGDIYNLDGSTKPTISESLPHVQLSQKSYDKSIYGVIAGIEDPNSEKDTEVRSYPQGMFSTAIARVDQDDYRLIINSGGEGAVWVSNYNGNVENGDLVATSPLNGIGMKQKDDIIRSHTVAKIVMDCDFDLNSDKYECKEVTHDGKTYRMALLACVYKCN